MTQCTDTLLVLTWCQKLDVRLTADVGHIIYDCHTSYKYGYRSCVSSQRVGVTGLMSISDMFQSYITSVRSPWQTEALCCYRSALSY